MRTAFKIAVIACLSAFGPMVYGLDRASAFEIFGLRFFERDAEDPNTVILDALRYETVFVVAGDASLEERLKAASGLWLERTKSVPGQAGLLSKAKADYRRLTAALYNAGHYGGGVSITIDGKEAADIRADELTSEAPTVTISVTTGDLYVFGQIAISQEAPVSVDERDTVTAVTDIGFRPGEAARAGTVRQAARLLVDAWREQGHAKATVVEEKVTANHPAKTLNVHLTLKPDALARYGDVTVQGTEDLDPAFLKRQSGLVPGQEYDPDDVEKARKRINRLDVLSTLKIEEGEEIDATGRLPITMTATERKKRRIGVGGTVSNVDGAGLEAFWLHRNLFGRAERLRVDGKVSGVGETFDATELDYEFGSVFTKPGVFRPGIDFNARFVASREFNDTFEENSIEAGTGLTYLRSDRLTLSAETTLQIAEFDDEFGTRDLITAGINAAAIYDRRDNELEPTKGFFLSGAANPFYEFEFANPGLRLDLEGRTYVSFGPKDRMTLAARGRLGSLVGPPRSETASDRLYFTGGGGSIRGFGFKTIGVTEDDGSVTGGRSLAETSLEARFRATESFGGVLFVDAGTIGEDAFVDFDEDVSVGIGAGVRYFTGIGAIRLDVGVPLNGGPDDPPVAFFAGIGQTF